MKKLFIAFVLITTSFSFLFSQESQKKLAVLPFVGSQGDAISIIISQERILNNAFTVLPRTAELTRLFEENRENLDGLTDTDVIAGIGEKLDADYVLSGNIRRLGDLNIFIAVLTHVESFELAFCFYNLFTDLGEIRSFLQTMSREMIASVNKNKAGLERLAIIPITPSVSAGIGIQEADTIAQMLAIDIFNSGNYVIIPRTSSIKNALNEINFQNQELTAEEIMAEAGQTINADSVLCGTAFKLGNTNIFNAKIIKANDSNSVISEDAAYFIISDTALIIPRIAVALTIKDDREKEKLLAKLPVPVRQANPFAETPESTDTQKSFISSPEGKTISRRNIIDVYILMSLSGEESKPIFGAGAGISFSPVSFFNFGVDAKISFINQNQENETTRESIWAFSPNIGFAIPLRSNMRLFANAFIDMGKSEPWNTGIIAEWATPGITGGLDIILKYNISIKYRGLIYKERYVNAISVGIGIPYLQKKK